MREDVSCYIERVTRVEVEKRMQRDWVEVVHPHNKNTIRNKNSGRSYIHSALNFNIKIYSPCHGDRPDAGLCDLKKK